LLKRDLLAIARLIKDRLGDQLFAHFEMQLSKALEQRYKNIHEHDAEASVPMPKKTKASDQEQS